jgi:hypothetical protein
MKRIKITWLWTGFATTFGRFIYRNGESYPSKPIGWQFRPIQRFNPTGYSWVVDFGPLRIAKYAPCTC